MATFVTPPPAQVMVPYSQSFISILSGLPPSSTSTSTPSTASGTDPTATLYKNPSSQSPYLFLPLPHFDRVLAINPTLLPTPPTAASLVSLSTCSKVLIILLRSGALSHCLFTNATISHHATKRHYTVRKGQGGSQSSNDKGKGKANSMGAQLRRDGERKTREDCRAIGCGEDIDLIVIGCPKVMRGGLLSDLGLTKDDARLRVLRGGYKVKFEECKRVFKDITRVEVRPMNEEEERIVNGNGDGDGEDTPQKLRAMNLDASEQIDEESESEDETDPTPPLTPLHTEVQSSSANLSLPSPHLDTQAGPDLSTPLHLACSLNLPTLVSQLLAAGASPVIKDARWRVPWQVCSSNACRLALRKGRALAESGSAPSYDWDSAKIPSIDLEAEKERQEAQRARQKEKEKEKKKRQKERKKKEKAEKEEADKRREEEEAEAKRKADFQKSKLHLKTVGERACDWCGSEVRFAKDLLRWRDYKYCKPECVREHKRECAAKAAEKRFG